MHRRITASFSRHRAWWLDGDRRPRYHRSDLNDEIVSHDASVTAAEQPSDGPARRPAFRPGTVLAGRYRRGVVRGRGGMWSVVRAYDQTLGAHVALKLLHEALQSDRRWTERLAREVKTTRQIRHPNVCRVFDFQNANGMSFIVMELAERTLADELETGESIARSLDARLADVRAIARGLAAIHSMGIVHRDISARNILRLADQRLVLSDLGLAVVAGDNPATLQGGTIAYMAPELVAGARASVASDIWALGIVIYEAVFGGRPAWRDGAVVRGIERPGRRLTRPEEAVLALCRDCTAARPSDRPRSATDVLTRLDLGTRGRRPVGRRIVAGAGAAMLIVGTALVVHQIRQRQRGVPVAATDIPIELAGEPRDWTDSSRLLASIPDKILCMVPLPRSHVVRIVWGSPPKAEDIDVDTGIRRPSPLVPDAYAHGCPDLAPDGALIFQGFNQEGHPGIFLSPHSDGSGAHFVVSAADPSYLSEPRWLASGRGFVFDVDVRHIAVLDRATERSFILPGDTTRDDYSIFRFVAGDRVFSLRRETGQAAVHVRALSWPNVTPDMSFTVSGVSSAWGGSADGRLYASEYPGRGLAEVDIVHRRATRLGIIKNSSFLTAPCVVQDKLVFISFSASSDAWQGQRHALRQITHGGNVAQASRCFDGDVLVSQESASGEPELVRLRPDGTSRTIFPGRRITAPACSKLRDEWWHTEFSRSKPITYHCLSGSCTEVGGGFLVNALSPDESRIASIGLNTQGQYTLWYPSRGGPTHEIAHNQTNCPPVWASNTTLWVSTRRGERFLWTELNVDTGLATGRTMPGGSDCADGTADPLSPDAADDLRVIFNVRGEVRAIPLADLTAPSRPYGHSTGTGAL